MLRKMRREDIPAIVEIHRSSWNPSEISVKLGPKFLEYFYSTILQAPDAFTYLFEQEGKIVAYSTGFYKYREFSKRMLKSHCILFLQIILFRFLFGYLAVADICNMLLDFRKLRSLRYPDAHWGANAVATAFKGTQLGKEAYALTANAVFRDLQQAGCGGCGVACDSENKAIEKWLIRLGFKKVDTVFFWRRSVLIYEKTFRNE
jgi:RimJ/RimL family protein N-acetyltransferase